MVWYGMVWYGMGLCCLATIKAISFYYIVRFLSVNRYIRTRMCTSFKQTR